MFLTKFGFSSVNGQSNSGNYISIGYSIKVKVSLHYGPFSHEVVAFYSVCNVTIISQIVFTSDMQKRNIGGLMGEKTALWIML
jgi:hypothetical protein